MISRARRVGTAVCALFALQLLIQCVEHEPGIAVRVSLVHHDGSGGERADGEARVFFTNLGYQISITSAYVSVEAVELVPCTTAARSRSLLSRMQSVAHAHDPVASPLLLEAPAVIDLMVGDRDVIPLGVMSPPPGNYCGARVHLSPATADAAALAGAPELAGQTLRIRGTFVPPGGGEPMPFELTAADLADAHYEFVTLEGFQTVLELSAETLDGDVAVGLDYNLWFENVELLTFPEGVLRDQVVSNVLRSIHHHQLDPR